VTNGKAFLRKKYFILEYFFMEAQPCGIFLWRGLQPAGLGLRYAGHA
jgi:hypothetical protein